MTKKKNRQKELTSKVLCSLLAAGVLTVALPGGVRAAEESSKEYTGNLNITETIDGKNVSGSVVTFTEFNGSVATVQGFDKAVIKNNSTITFTKGLGLYGIAKEVTADSTTDVTVEGLVKTNKGQSIVLQGNNTINGNVWTAASGSSISIGADGKKTVIQGNVMADGGSAEVVLGTGDSQIGLPANGKGKSNIHTINGVLTITGTRGASINTNEIYAMGGGDLSVSGAGMDVSAVTEIEKTTAISSKQSSTIKLGTDGGRLAKVTAHGTGSGVFAKNEVGNAGLSKGPTIDIVADEVSAVATAGVGIWANIDDVSAGADVKAPIINIDAKNLTASGTLGAVIAQDGIINIGSREKMAENVVLEGKPDAQTTTDYAVVYVRGVSSDTGTGTVNIYSKNISIKAPEDGSAISGNGGGHEKVNINASEELSISGSIASYNSDQQAAGTSKMVIDINQDVAQAGKVTITGKYINAADKSEVNIKGGAGSSIKVFDKIIASASDNKGGIISIDFAEGGSVEGSLVAQNSGVINLGGKLTFDSAKTNFTTATDGVINLSSGEMDGVLNIAQGSSVSLSGATFTANDLANSVTGGGKLVLTGNGTLATTAGQVFSVGDAKLTGTDLTENAVIDAAKDKVTFTSGTLKLTDAEYSLDYVASAGAALKAGDTGSKTNVMMSGKLVENGEIKEEITIDQVTSVGDALLDDVVVKDDSKNILIGTTLDSNSSVQVGEVEIDSDSKTVATGFSASKLDLGAGSTGVVLTNKEELNLGGSKGGELITVGGSAAAEGVNLVIGTETAVGSATETAGTLNIGKFTAPETENKLTGAITVNDGSAVNVVNGNLTVTNGVTLAGGTMAVGNGVLNADIKAKENTTSTVTGAAVVSKLEAASGAVLNLGADDKAAHVTVENLELKGGTLFLDPVWKDGNQIGDGTKVAIAEAHTNGIDGKLVVGQNSTLSLGTKDTGLAEAAFAKTGLTWGDKGVLSAVYLANTIKLNDGSSTEGGLYVDPNAEKTTSVTNNTVTFNKGSLLMVDGAKVTTTAAISGVASNGATIEGGAVLYIDGAKKGETYKILDGADTGWENEDIIADNKLLAFTGDTTSDNKFDVEAKLQKVNAVFDDKVVIGNVVDATLAGNDENSAAYKFFENAVSSKFNATDAEAVNALNSFANMGELAGVSRGTYSMSNIMTDAVGDHLSLAGGEHQDTDIWARYVHNKEEVRDMDMGGMQGSYDLKYNGIVVGGDFYNQGKTTAGVALSYAKGDVNSVGNTVNTKNDAEYYGISLYGRINNGDSAVLGDISYLHGKNDITQNNSGMDITASPKSDAFSIGVKAEKTYALGDGKLVPFAGLRYLHLGVGDYSNSLGMHYNADDQNLWLLPVGVTYSHETKTGDWTVRPLVEAGYVWTAGDRSTNQTVSLNGTTDGFGYNVADSGSFVGRFVLEAEKANMTLGLGYEYQKGDSVKANRLMANVSFSF